MHYIRVSDISPQAALLPVRVCAPLAPVSSQRAPRPQTLTGLQPWPGRAPGLFDPSNVVVGGGRMQLWARATRRNGSWPAGYDNYTTAAVHSLARVRQGYFEIRWRSGSSSISSSWWFHTNDPATKTWTEIDVFETTGTTAKPGQGTARADQIPSHVHVFKLPNTTTAELPALCGGCETHGGAPPCSIGAYYKLPAASPTFSEAWHTASLNWTDAGVDIAIDGQSVNRIASPCLSERIGMDFDRETMPGWMALPDPGTLPDRPFVVDWVRAWRRV